MVLVTTALLEPDTITGDVTTYDRTRVSHYIRKTRHVTGVEVEALCGYVWIPTRSPSGLPICQQCKDIYDDDNSIIDAWGADA